MPEGQAKKIDRYTAAADGLADGLLPRSAYTEPGLAPGEGRTAEVADTFTGGR